MTAGSLYFLQIPADREVRPDFGTGEIMDRKLLLKNRLQPDDESPIASFRPAGADFAAESAGPGDGWMPQRTAASQQ
jgi:hypothetical protein